MKKNSDKPKLKDILQNTQPVPHKTVKVKNKASLRKCYRPEETKQTSQLNVMGYPRWDPEIENVWVSRKN